MDLLLLPIFLIFSLVYCVLMLGASDTPRFVMNLHEKWICKEYCDCWFIVTIIMIFVYRCIVPQITVISPLLDYGRCFLRHPYEHYVKLQNDTDLPAKYELVPQNIDQFTPIVYTSPQPKVLPISLCHTPYINPSSPSCRSCHSKIFIDNYNFLQRSFGKPTKLRSNTLGYNSVS